MLQITYQPNIHHVITKGHDIYIRETLIRDIYCC